MHAGSMTRPSIWHNLVLHGFFPPIDYKFIKSSKNSWIHDIWDGKRRKEREGRVNQNRSFGRQIFFAIHACIYVPRLITVCVSPYTSVVGPLPKLWPWGDVLPSDIHLLEAYRSAFDFGVVGNLFRFAEFRSAGEACRLSLELAFEWVWDVSEPLFVLNVYRSLLCVLESRTIIEWSGRRGEDIKIVNYAVYLVTDGFQLG